MILSVNIRTALRWCLYSFLAGMAFGPLALATVLKLLGRLGVTP